MKARSVRSVEQKPELIRVVIHEINECFHAVCRIIRQYFHLRTAVQLWWNVSCIRANMEIISFRTGSTIAEKRPSLSLKRT